MENTELSVTEKCEMIRQVLKVCNNYYYSSKVKYENISDYLTDDVIKHISYRADNKISLHNILHCLYDSGREIMIKKIYQLRNDISSRELMQIYLEDIKSGKNIIESTVFAEKQINAPVSAVNSKVCGCPEKWRVKKLKISDRIKDAIASDVPETFAIYSNLAGQNMSLSFINMLFQQNAVNIFSFLIQQDLIPERIISLNELAAYIICNLPQQDKLAFLQTIEKAKPGCLKNFRDKYGRNILWYSMFKDNYWNNQENELVQYLLSLGCDPDNQNALETSWRYFMVNAPVKNFPYHIYHKNKKPEKTISSYVRDFQGCEVIGGHIGIPKVLKFTRVSKKSSLLPKVNAILTDLIKETFWNFEFNPDQTLPASYGKHITHNILNGNNMPEKIEKIVKRAMRAYHHPQARKPLELHSSELLLIPKKVKCKGAQDWGENKALEILRTGFMMYNPLVRQYLLKMHYDLCKTMRFIDIAPCGEVKDEALRKAIGSDDVQEFIKLLGNEKNVSPEIADAVLRGGKLNILSYMLDEILNFTTMYKPKELVFFAASQLDDETGSVVLAELEKRWPHIIGSSCDEFASEPLYYAMFNKNIRWYDKNCKLVKTLLDGGCKFDYINIFGISVGDILHNLTEKDIADRQKYLDFLQENKKI